MSNYNPITLTPKGMDQEEEEGGEESRREWVHRVVLAWSSFVHYVSFGLSLASSNTGHSLSHRHLDANLWARAFPAIFVSLSCELLCFAATISWRIFSETWRRARFHHCHILHIFRSALQVSTSPEKPSQSQEGECFRICLSLCTPFPLHCFSRNFLRSCKMNATGTFMLHWTPSSVCRGVELQ